MIKGHLEISEHKGALLRWEEAQQQSSYQKESPALRKSDA